MLVLCIVDVQLLLDLGFLGVVPLILAKFLGITSVSPGARFFVQEAFSVFFLESQLELLFPLGMPFTLAFIIFGCPFLFLAMNLSRLQILVDTIAFVILAVFFTERLQ